MSHTTPRRVLVHPDPNTLAAATAARLITRLIDLQSVQAPVHLVLTGGTIGIQLLAEVAKNPAAGAVDWSEVHFWWGDERFLPAGDPDRNETQAREALLDSLAARFEPLHLHPMPPLDPAQGVSTPDEAAARYREELAAYAHPGLPTPKFDVLLLGMGPDGHIASLFPGKAEINARDISAVGVENSPKPPPERVSLSLEVIQQARAVWVVAAGQEKAEALAAALSHAPLDQIPAAGAAGTEETLWLVDLAAAGLPGE